MERELCYTIERIKFPGVMAQQLDAVILPSLKLELEWTECEDGAFDKASQEVQKRIFRDFQKSRGLFFCGLVPETISLPASLAFWTRFAREFVRELLLAPDIEQKRGKIELPFPDSLRDSLMGSAPAMVGVELLDGNFLERTWKDFHIQFREAVGGHQGSIESLLRKLTPNHELSNRIHFHLVENRRDPESPFAFMATYSTASDKPGMERHVPLHFALKEFSDHREKLVELLSAVHKAARRSSLIKTLLDSGELFQPISLTAQEAFRFLSDVSIFEENGILCRIPRWWTGKPRRISLGLAIGNTAPGALGIKSLLDFKAGLHVDGEPVSESEARAIAAQYSGLALIKGKWVAVDPDALKQTLSLFEKARQLARRQKITLAEAMQFMMGNGVPGALDGVEAEGITCGPWLGDILKKMGDPSLTRSVKLSSNIRAKLRPYQVHGVSWLNFLHGLGFGMCLADDMGLGKTLEVLALLQTLKEREKDFSTCLAVVPASLMSNWLQEISKFTPGLRAVAAHPQMMEAKDFKSLPKKLGEWDLVITTYAMARKLGWLGKTDWYYTILDEAQAIKNAGTAQTRAVKEIGGRHRLVLTGTPVENRLGDLWSLFDFINPGLLGGVSKFKLFTKALENNPAGYGRLRKVIRPYILRRLKTDKSIISDLPDKLEMKCYAELSRHQAVLYQELVDQLAGELEDSEGIQRRGIVLAYLIRFKQLCNHPDQLTGQKGYEEAHGGKFARLREICETIYEKRERVLVFTQFREIIEPLDRILKLIFRREGLILHGQTSMKGRRESVARFQGEEYIPYFILSLKAGGTGLNLTAANHVVHFDRWWNPAVENQATDRAFRIGQKKNVVVHKFICKGTIEEKIDGMIEDKKALSEKVLSGGGENWITEFNNEKLIEMFKLAL